MIWGSTWIMITFQLGVVEPLVSVVYRFALASLILFIYSLFNKKSFSFTPKEHGLILLQGLFLFGFDYWMTYIGVTLINSALAAILSTSIVYFNVIFSRIILGDKIRLDVLIGATIGIVGIMIIFIPEVQSNNDKLTTWEGIGFVLLGSIFASIGSVLSAGTQRRNIPVLQSNALGMGYAALFLGFIAFVSDVNYSIDFSTSYIASLIYLALFGSVIAFGAFLKLVGRVGPDKAAYVSLIYPVIAMFISTLFENYQWTTSSFIGLFIILSGNFIAMGKYKSLPIYQRFKQASELS